MAYVVDDLDIPIDVVLEGDFAGSAAPPRPATAAAQSPLASAKAFDLEELVPLDEEVAETSPIAATAPMAATARKPESKAETLERLLAQVRERRRSRSAA